MDGNTKPNLQNLRRVISALQTDSVYYELLEQLFSLERGFKDRENRDPGKDTTEPGPMTCPRHLFIPNKSLLLSKRDADIKCITPSRFYHYN